MGRRYAPRSMTARPRMERWAATDVAGFTQGFRAERPLARGRPVRAGVRRGRRDAGLSLIETQALSVLVFAGSAQLSAVGLFGSGAAALEIVSTTFLLNVRHVLYGLSLGRRIPLRGWRRATAAYFLTDEAFGVVAAREERTFAFLLGAELSLFATWNLATLGGRSSARRSPTRQSWASTSSSRSRSSRSSSRSSARASSCSSRSRRVRWPTSSPKGCPAGSRSWSPGSPGACSGPR